MEFTLTPLPTNTLKRVNKEASWVSKIERRSVTSRYHGSTISGWQQNTKPTTTATARRSAKNDMFILTNNNFARASRWFLHFFVVVAALWYERSKFHEPALWSRWTQHKTYCFLFLNLDNNRYGPKENFAKICQISLKFIRLLRVVFVMTTRSNRMKFRLLPN